MFCTKAPHIFKEITQIYLLHKTDLLVGFFWTCDDGRTERGYSMFQKSFSHCLYAWTDVLCFWEINTIATYKKTTLISLCYMCTLSVFNSTNVYFSLNLFKRLFCVVEDRYNTATEPVCHYRHFNSLDSNPALVKN